MQKLVEIKLLKEGNPNWLPKKAQIFRLPIKKQAMALASIVLTDLNNKIKVVRKQERISLK